MTSRSSVTFFCILFYWFVINTATQENLLLPFALTLTASPGEFRGPHLHAGIDLSTKQTTGWPVHVISDGIVIRIKSKMRSEGKAVYVKHKNGSISVYAHLEDFASELMPLVPKKRYFDIFPKNKIKVSKGQTLGFSGESGAGLPHLHFEIRKDLATSSKESILFKQFEEYHPPLIEKIHFIKPETGELNVSLSAEQLNRSLDKPLVFMEPLAIAVQMFDRVKSKTARCNVPYFRLKNDQEILFEAHLDEVRFPRNYHSSMHFLTQFTGFQPTIFSYKMYRDYPQPSPFIKNHINDGWLKAGNYQLELEAWDYFGNRTFQKIPVKVLKQNVPTPKPDWMELASAKEYTLQSGPAKLIFNTNFCSRLDEVKLTWIPGLQPEVRIGPAGVFFTRNATLILPLPKMSYWANLAGPLNFEKKSDHIVIKLSGSEHLKLYPDKERPWISEHIRSLAGLRKKRHYIRAGDSLSGLDHSSVKAQCINQERFIEWDPDRRWLWVEEPCQNMQITLCDRVGLCNSKTVNFFVGKTNQ